MAAEQTDAPINSRINTITAIGCEALSVFAEHEDRIGSRIRADADIYKSLRIFSVLSHFLRKSDKKSAVSSIIPHY